MAQETKGMFVKIIWDYEGFKEEDLSKWKLQSIKNRCFKMYKAYARWVNEEEIFDKLNKRFFAEHPSVKLDDYGDSFNSLSNYMYGSFLAYNINKILWGKDGAYYNSLRDIGLYDVEIQPAIYMDGAIPDISFILKNHPGWSIRILLDEIKEL